MAERKEGISNDRRNRQQKGTIKSSYKGAGKRSRKKRKRTGKKKSHAPLGDQIRESKETGNLRAPKISYAKNEDDSDVPMISERLTRKILNEARRQQTDIESGGKSSKPASSSAKRSRLLSSIANNSDEPPAEMINIEWDAVEQSQEISMEDARALELFMPDQIAPRRTLADIIMEKMAELGEKNTDVEEAVKKTLDPKICKVYTEVGAYLQHYRSGNIPKPFKIIPTLRNWEDILLITRPEKWSPYAMFIATRLFAYNLNTKMAQRFFNLVLLPRVRDNIDRYQKLNYHLYKSITKAIWKPQAFFKGILLPLAEGGCNGREAIIFSSVLRKFTVPAMHSAVALLKMSQLEYSGCTTLFMKTLLDKKYSLPSRVVDTLVKYYCRFTDDDRNMPVIFHQSLLCFIQRYKFAMSTVQRSKLKRLMRYQNHPLMTPEIRRELNLAHPSNATPSVPQPTNLSF